LAAVGAHFPNSTALHVLMWVEFFIRGEVRMKSTARCWAVYAVAFLAAQHFCAGHDE